MLYCINTIDCIAALKGELKDEKDKHASEIPTSEQLGLFELQQHDQDAALEKVCRGMGSLCGGVGYSLLYYVCAYA